MRTFPTLSRLLFLSLAMVVLHLTPMANTELVLMLDGKVRTKGVPLDGTRVLVTRNGIQVQMINDGVGRIHLQLDLQAEYIISFERKGCMTKELHFNTTVPEEALENSPFFFPFLVTLEERSLGEEFKYSHPVGFIRYYPDKKDFGYDTNYMLRRDLQRKEEAARSARPYGLPPEGRTTSSMAISEKEIVPRKSSIDVDGSTDPSSSVDGKMDQSTGDGLSDEESAAPVPAFTRSIAPHGSRGLDRIGASPIKSAPVTKAIQPNEVITPIMPDGREDEVLVEPTYVARIVRITQGGNTKEFRRISHRYGATHYFCDGSSCQEATFKRSVSEK